MNERCKLYQHKRRIGGTIDEYLWKMKCILLNNKCQICQVHLMDNEITIDHIIPITKNGTNDIDNLQPLCGSCNSMKGNRAMSDYV